MLSKKNAKLIMNYQTYQPHPDLSSLINFYWILEIPADANAQRQRIVPDGGIEMAFILGDDIKRYTSENDFILQPQAMVIGQTLEPFYIEPTGYVNTFAISFYPFGFANFVKVPIKDLANKETPIERLFEKDTARELEINIRQASDSKQRIKIIETFLLNQLKDETVIDNIVKSTVDTLLLTKGSASIKKILCEDLSKRRQLERKFKKQIGVSPKQFGKIIRLQTALKMLLNEKAETLTNIAYKSEYFDQAHFTKDFKEFTGINPKEFLGNENMALTSLFYK